MTTPPQDQQTRSHLACLNLVSTYNLLVDSGRATQIIDLVTPDFTTSVPGHGELGHAEFAESLAARQAKVDRHTCHSLVNFVFHGSDGRTATASSTISVTVLSDGPGAPPLFLRSADSFEMDDDGEWRLSRREGELLPLS